MKIFKVRPVGQPRRWVVVNTQNGTIHSNRIADKARADRQANTMNRKMEMLLKGCTSRWTA